MLYYTGIGSREAPKLIQQDMILFAKFLAVSGYCLRSGGARGADQAFETGCDSQGGRKEIYLPWEGFEGNTSTLFPASPEASILASTIHPTWNKLSKGARSLVSRNMHQVLGQDLNTPSEFVICWTPDGCSSEKTYSRETGGTGTAITLASRNNIPVINLQHNSHFSYLVNVLLPHLEVLS